MQSRKTAGMFSGHSQSVSQPSRCTGPESALHLECHPTVHWEWLRGNSYCLETSERVPEREFSSTLAARVLGVDRNYNRGGHRALPACNLLYNQDPH